MNKNILLTTLIVFLFIGLCYTSLVLSIGAGFIFCGDIDLPDEVNNGCLYKARWFSWLSLFILLVSSHGIFFSGVISKKILKSFGNTSVNKLNL